MIAFQSKLNFHFYDNKRWLHCMFAEIPHTERVCEFVCKFTSSAAGASVVDVVVVVVVVVLEKMSDVARREIELWISDKHSIPAETEDTMLVIRCCYKLQKQCYMNTVLVIRCCFQLQKQWISNKHSIPVETEDTMLDVRDSLLF